LEGKLVELTLAYINLIYAQKNVVVDGLLKIDHKIIISQGEERRRVGTLLKSNLANICI
jgi:hypothetical protein